MSKPKKIIMVAAIIIIIMCIGLIAYISGKGINGKFSGKNSENPDTKNGLSVQPSTQQMNNTPETSLSKSGTEQDKQDNAKEKKRLTVDKVKAVYLSGDSAGNKAKIDQIIELSKTTELNAVVIDVKEAGKVNYETGLEAVNCVGAYEKKYNPEELVQKLHDNNIYVIGRVVCFRDPGLAEKRPDLAVKKVNGEIWREGKLSWTNPYLDEVQRYNIDIAKEAADKGFDEIQFDYVRFPTTKKGEVNYGDVPPKADAISKFLETASRELHEKGVLVSADVFAIICESPSDGEAIGQVLERIGKDLDYISPMVYPSHYANAAKKGVMANGVGQSVNGVLFKAPDLEPYNVVYNTLLKTKDRISKAGEYKAKIRPYLQAFTATYLPAGYYRKYGPQQIREQIKAVDDARCDGWILWDPRNSYSADYFEKK